MTPAQRARGYAFAVLATGGVVGIELLLRLIGHPPPFSTYFPAILVSGWWWGRGPAIASAALCAVAGILLRGGPTNVAVQPDALGIVIFLVVAGILATMSSAFREARDRAESARRRLGNFLESTGDAFMAFDSEWRYVYVNPRAAHFARRSASEMVGRTLFELFPDIKTVPFFEAAEKVMRERVPVSVESYYAPLDTWFENDIYPIDDGISVFYRDITERRRAAEVREDLLRRERAARTQSETANRLKDEFLATLSHELRTPLNAITGWATLLGGGRLDADERAHAVETIQRNARAQTHLIEDLLDVSRIVAGKLRLDVQTVELAPVFQAALEAVRPAAQAKDITLAVAMDPEATFINGDPARLQQVAWNILSNAIKFTPRAGRVRLTLRRQGSFAELIVSDTGIGIPSHMLKRIFDRFTQADSSSTREFHGLGLGLALVRYLVEAHGGTVTASSPGEGHGATFTVALPLRPEVPAPPLDEQIDSGEEMVRPIDDSEVLADVSVQVVDDDVEARELLAKMLTDLGATVRTASSAAEAFAQLENDLPDVLLSDIEMPGEDGYSLIRRLRSRPDAGGRIPAIAITAYARVQDRARALREGFDNHIAKPVYIPELVAVIRRSVDAARSAEGHGPATSPP